MTVTRRVLGRTTLARQLLLRRAELPLVTAVERVLGLNAQDPNPPYYALWSRLAGFAIEDLTTAIENRSLVRSTLMRATQHLLSVPDFRLIRPALAPLLKRVQRNAFGIRTASVDLDKLLEQARELLAGGIVLTRPELGRRLAREWPYVEPAALGWTVQYLYPLVHPAPSGTWETRGPTPFADASWTGVGKHTDLGELVRRYLAAFGPASVADARAFTGIGGLREVFATLDLRRYRDESGRELYDLPDASLADPDEPAPVRLLPAFDAPLLAFADRSRVMTDDVRRQVCVGAAVAATVLVDGMVAAQWTVSRDGELTVCQFRALSAAERDDIEAEATRLLDFAHPGGRVVFAQSANLSSQ